MRGRKQKATDVMQPLGDVIDEESWDWLMDNRPEVAIAVRDVVEGGASAEEIRSYVMRQTERKELALRCEQAARHVARSLGLAAEE